MKPETQQLLRRTLHEIQNNKSNKNDSTNSKKIKTIIHTLEHEQKQADPAIRTTYQEPLHNWYFLLCQEPYYQYHVFSSRSGDPAFIDTLFQLLERDERPEFKLKVAIALGMSLLAIHYPVISTQHRPLFKSIKLYLETLYSQDIPEPHFVLRLTKQLDELLQDNFPKYFELTNLYNALTLENIAKHGLMCSSDAQKYGFCLTSVDGNTSNRFSCSAIDLKPQEPSYGPKTLDGILKVITEDPITGIFQIPIERDGKFKDTHLSGDDLRVLIQNRINASVLFIFNHPSLRYSNKDCTYSEQRLDEPLTPETLQAILVPSKCLSLARQAFPNTPLIVVENTEITLKPSRSVQNTLPNLSGQAYSLSVPDYVEGLKRYVRQFKPERFYTHITRLALEHDMSEFLLPSDPWSRKQLTTEAKHAIFTRKFSQKPALRRSQSTELLIAYPQSKMTDPKIEATQHTALTVTLGRHQRSLSN